MTSLRWLGPMWLRRIMLLPLDGVIALTALVIALLLRFEGDIPEGQLHWLPVLAAVMAGCRIVASLAMRTHRWSFRLSNLMDGARVVVAAVLGSGLSMIVVYMVRIPGPPRSVVVIDGLLATVLMLGVRFSPRVALGYARDQSRARGKTSTHTLIVGAGAAGDLLLRDLQRAPEHSHYVVGFVDDDPNKLGMIVGGKTVLGTMRDLPRLVEEQRVAQVLNAIPQIEPARIREILTLCMSLHVRFKILPVSYRFLSEKAPATMLQDLTPEDLLARPQVRFDDSGEAGLVIGRCALVTGAAGSIGSEICLQLARAGAKSLVLVDINENNLYMLGLKLNAEYPEVGVHLEVADIRDASRIRALFETYRPQDVFHAAAHKHVPLMEIAPCEAIKNNVLGTRIVASAADEYGAERFAYISTDKAVRPTSVMGASKRVGEQIVRALARTSTTDFKAVRFGNVLGSAGSVVPIFREQISAGRAITVTHKDVRRYFMTISEAVGLVLKAAYSNYGELCVLNMGEQIKILDLAHHMIVMSGLVPDVDVPIEFTGLRPGEKLYEELMTEAEERTVLANSKIFVAHGPPPPGQLWDLVDRLVGAANEEDTGRVLSLLRVLIPSYCPAQVVPLVAAEPLAGAENAMVS